MSSEGKKGPFSCFSLARAQLIAHKGHIVVTLMALSLAQRKNRASRLFYFACRTEEVIHPVKSLQARIVDRIIHYHHH